MSHIYVLTYNRPAILQRSLATVLDTADASDDIIVLDDSSPIYARENAQTVRALTNRVVLIDRSDMLRLMNKFGWLQLFRRRSSYEIGRLRNFALCYSAKVGEHTTIMIDDDIIGYNIKQVKTTVLKLKSQKANSVIGFRIIGIDSRDTISRFDTALRKLVGRKNHLSDCLDILSLLRVDDPPSANNLMKTTRLSGGLLLINCDASKLPPFPRSYNESWIWCRILDTIHHVPTYKVDSSIIHMPEQVRKVSLEGLIREQEGVYAERLLYYSDDDEVKNIPDALLLKRASPIVIEKSPLRRLVDIQTEFLNGNKISRGEFDVVWNCLCNAPWNKVVSVFRKHRWFERFFKWQKEYNILRIKFAEEMHQIFNLQSKGDTNESIKTGIL